MGYNLEDQDTCGLNDPTDLVNTSPGIGVIGDNGGPFVTYALVNGSAAIDGAGTACSAADGRGAPRPADGDDDGTAACDIGAFELSPSELDFDGDGYCVGLDIGGVLVCLEGASGDCDDADSAVNPGATEVCNAIDDDCDALVDDADPSLDTATQTEFFVDADGDDYGDASVPSTMACFEPPGYTLDDTDCDDADSAVNPAATEICNEIDDDCDALTDDADGTLDLTTAISSWTDADLDGYGDPSTELQTCVVPAGNVYNADDCDDTSDAVNPAATEVCNAIVDNCDAIVDDDDANLDLSTATTSWADVDADGYGDPSAEDVTCVVPTGNVYDSSDCDDTDSAVNPSATEICNAIDDDCDGLIDDDDDGVDLSTGTSSWTDADGDGFGDPATELQSCDVPATNVENPDDCDDSSAKVNPDAEEIRNNDIDDDCDGKIDKDDPDVKGCGCDSAPSPSSAWLVGLAILGLRRRRR